MKINTDDQLLKDLELALSYYVKGLVVKLNSIEVFSNIQRIIEQTLLNYSKLDIEEQNFINISISDINDYILIELYSENVTSCIELRIPYSKKKILNNSPELTTYFLEDKVSINIKTI